MKKLLLIALLFSLAHAKAQIITTVAGNGIDGYTGDGGQATAAELGGISGISFDATGNMYISDAINNVIRKINTQGIIATIAGNGTQGYNGDGGQATDAEFHAPNGLTFDGIGNLYIADAENDLIRKINTMGIISTFAGGGTSGLGDGGQATAAEIGNPFGICFDPIGNFYVADNINNVIRKVNTAGIISTIAGNSIGGYSGDGGQATDAKLWEPFGITFDEEGNLFIADNANNVIRKVNTAGIISTIAGNGTQGYSGDGGQATVAELYSPYGICFDALGNLYIAETYNQVVRKVTTTGVISTIAGNGYHSGIAQAGGYSGDGGQATAAELNEPTMIAINATGDLYIADLSNNRVRKVTNVTTTGIEQIKNNNEQINIYPNPNNGSFVIEPSSATKQTILVHDVNGKLVLSQSIMGRTSIDANSLNEGVYNISLKSNEGVVNKRLVIVR